MAALICFGVVGLLMAHSPSPADAFASDVELECNENPVEEGRSFRLHIVNSQTEPGEVENMKVYWTTVSDTAGGLDYLAVRREAQTSTNAQAISGRMGRTFYTTDNTVSELTESFKVKAVNAQTNTEIGNCTIEIEDDDGPGAYKTWIDSTPGEDRGSEWEADCMPDADKYFKGETIRIKQQFTEEVNVRWANVTIKLYVGDGNNGVRRNAKYVAGTGTDTLVFTTR